MDCACAFTTWGGSRLVFNKSIAATTAAIVLAFLIAPHTSRQAQAAESGPRTAVNAATQTISEGEWKDIRSLMKVQNRTETLSSVLVSALKLASDNAPVTATAATIQGDGKPYRSHVYYEFTGRKDFLFANENSASQIHYLHVGPDMRLIGAVSLDRASEHAIPPVEISLQDATQELQETFAFWSGWISPKQPRHFGVEYPTPVVLGDSPAPQSQATHTSCPSAGHPVDPVFRDLKGINFYLQIPQRLQDALNCHGREDECASRYSDHEQYKHQLIADYNAYPEELRPANLTRIFVDRIRKVILPSVQPDNQCRRPDINVLTTEDGRWPSGLTPVTQPNILTVAVKLVVDDIARPPQTPAIAVLSVHLFRPDCGFADFGSQVFAGGVVTGASILPLNLSSDALTKRLSYVVDHSPLAIVFNTEDSTR